MESVYLLWYVVALKDREDDLLLGVYRTEADATLATERVRQQRGFSKASGEFKIDRYELNKDHWTEGFFID